MVYKVDGGYNYYYNFTTYFGSKKSRYFGGELLVTTYDADTKKAVKEFLGINNRVSWKENF